MNQPNGYEEVKAYNPIRNLPAGGYVCKLVNVKERTNKHNAPMVAAALEVTEGDFAGYFTDKWNAWKNAADNPAVVKYPNEAVAYINVTDKSGMTSRQFKSFCVAVEDSGTPIVWGDKFAESIKNASIGVIFRREEEAYEGKRYWRTRPFAFTSAENIRKGNYTVPDDKPLAEDYSYGYGGEPPVDSYAGTGFTEVADDFPI